MSDERKPVLCRCGKEMKLQKEKTLMKNADGTTRIPLDKFLRHKARYHCVCGWTSPEMYGETEEVATQNAYDAAMKTGN